MSNLVLGYRNGLSRYEIDENTGLSDEAGSESQALFEILEHYYYPVSRKTLFMQFYELSEQWKEETEFYSSVTDICMHPAYQRIIGMGSIVLPFIFCDLKAELNHWFWALSTLTDVDPIPPESRGKMEEMRKSWLDWAKENNYL